MREIRDSQGQRCETSSNTISRLTRAVMRCCKQGIVHAVSVASHLGQTTCAMSTMTTTTTMVMRRMTKPKIRRVLVETVHTLPLVRRRCHTYHHQTSGVGVARQSHSPRRTCDESHAVQASLGVVYEAWGALPEPAMRAEVQGRARAAVALLREPFKGKCQRDLLFLHPLTQRHKTDMAVGNDLQQRLLQCATIVPSDARSAVSV